MGNRMNKKIDFTEVFDDLFVISHEMIKGRGEDNYYCAHCKRSAILSIFDGCGGLGAQAYASFQGHTGAYMASRVASGAVHDWYHDNYRRTWRDVHSFAESLKDYIKKGYEVCTAEAQSNLRLRGSMVRDFPTTAAIAFAQPDTTGVSLFVVWAGDSRVYLMDQKGLAQLSRDDVEGEDTMSNLSNDGALTNLLSADGRFVLHTKCLHITEPTVIFAATDGCFGYIPTPMEFEHLLLSELLSASNPKEFKKNLGKKIGEYAGDDYALGMMGMYFGSFSNMQKFFRNRMQLLAEKYVLPLQTGRDTININAMWQEYRRDYERYL